MIAPLYHDFMMRTMHEVDMVNGRVREIEVVAEAERGVAARERRVGVAARERGVPARERGIARVPVRVIMQTKENKATSMRNHRFSPDILQELGCVPIALVLRLNDDAANVRWIVFKLLGEFRSDAFELHINAIVQDLGDENPQVRWNISDILVELRPGVVAPHARSIALLSCKEWFEHGTYDRQVQRNKSVQQANTQTMMKHVLWRFCNASITRAVMRIAAKRGAAMAGYNNPTLEVPILVTPDPTTTTDEDCALCS